jgi:hypothetical protein
MLLFWAASQQGTAPPVDNAVLLEDGDFLLLEDGDFILLE